MKNVNKTIALLLSVVMLLFCASDKTPLRLQAGPMITTA